MPKPRTRDDLFHRVPLLSRVVLVWKENMYINVYDHAQNFVGVHHLSIEPQSRKGFFNAVYKHGDKQETYSNRAEIPSDVNGLNEVSDGRLTIKVVKPRRQLQVRFKGDTFQTVLDYAGRFDVFDYVDCPLAGESPLMELGRRALPYQHQEQGLLVSGSAKVDGKKLKIEGIANRDHSWGLRNEFVFDWHHWTGIHFKDHFINFCLIRDKTAEPPVKHGGFVSRKGSNTAIKRIVVREEPPRQERPDNIYCRLEDVKGNIHKLVFEFRRALGPIYFPNIPVEENLVYEMMDGFGTWIDEKSEEKGRGLYEIGRLKDTASGKYRYAR